jgi:hypothetical protein
MLWGEDDQQGRRVYEQEERTHEPVTVEAMQSERKKEALSMLRLKRREGKKSWLTSCKNRVCLRANPVAAARARVSETRDDRFPLVLQVPHRRSDGVAVNDRSAARVDAEDDSADGVVFAGFLETTDDGSGSELCRKERKSEFAAEEREQGRGE